MGLHSGGGGVGTQAHNFSSGEPYEVNLLNDYQISLHPDDPDSGLCHYPAPKHSGTQLLLCFITALTSLTNRVWKKVQDKKIPHS